MAAWEELLTDLVRVRGAALHRYGFLLCGDREEAADLVQESLVRTFSRPGGDWELGAVEAYVRRAMLNQYLDLHRRRMRLFRLSGRLARADVLADPSPDVVQRIDLMERLSALSPRQRACLVLRYFEDRSVADIAAELRCSTGTVKRHLSDALARLEVAMGPGAGAEGAGKESGSGREPAAGRP